MKIYRIKLKDYAGYVRGVEIGGEPPINPMITFEIENAAWYEEDKAKAYMSALNQQSGEELFVLEFVKETQNDR